MLYTDLNYINKKNLETHLEEEKYFKTKKYVTSDHPL